MSREEFQKYWFEQHGPLVKKHGSVLNIKRYVQVHTTGTELNSAFRELRGGPEPYDGVAELWWESAEDLQAGMASDEGQAAAQELLDDERTFIDLPNSPLWVAEERPVFG